jgi:hypothetical protein
MAQRGSSGFRRNHPAHKLAQHSYQAPKQSTLVNAKTETENFVCGWSGL